MKIAELIKTRLTLAAATDKVTMNTAEDFIILEGHVYQHNKEKNLTIGLSKPVKLKNSRYFLNTPRIYFQEMKKFDFLKMSQ